jgi:60 kDa SS-A/Ro ribonucleoprotein
MANTNLFNTNTGSSKVKADTKNFSGGLAYSLKDEEALAQYAMTGTFSDTFHTEAKEQLDKTIELANKVSPEFLAQVAVYSRSHGLMKDMPAVLLAVLSVRDVNLFKKAFPLVIDNGKMLRNFVQIMRSGAVGRKSLGSAPKKLIRSFIQSRTDKQLLNDSVGQTPSLADLIKMVHPVPRDKSQEALFAYIIGKKLTDEQENVLPGIVQSYRHFQAGNAAVPNVDFRLLTSLPLSDENWKTIAQHAKWMMTRMNLNTFERHGVFKDPLMVDLVAKRLADPKEVKGARAFPYQLLTAYLNIEDSIPMKIKLALQDAMEVATQNVPTVKGKVYICVDVSGSMGWAITGRGTGQASKTTCRDVAALVAACIQRANPDAEVIAFHNEAMKVTLNPRDSVMTNSNVLRKLPSGGTDCSKPLALLNDAKAKGDVVIYVSDNESWMDRGYGNRTGVQTEWDKFKARNKDAKLVLIDILASATSQAQSRKDVLNIGGFSDRVFEVISAFIESSGNANFWVNKIKETKV